MLAIKFCIRADVMCCISLSCPRFSEYRYGWPEKHMIQMSSCSIKHLYLWGGGWVRKTPDCFVVFQFTEWVFIRSVKTLHFLMGSFCCQ